MSPSIKKNTVIIIAGPTAVGKTALAIQLAQHFATKIISADSRQCFQELNIGVAKPTHEELKAVHHYFINSHSIHQTINAGIFEHFALEAAEEIFTSCPVAVMVGGTGLYLKAFCEGMDAMPQIDDEVRNSIIAHYETKGLIWLQNELKEKDPIFWQTAEQQNPHRLMRALEIVNATGKSINEFRKQQKIERPFNIIKIGLQLPKEELHLNINKRVDNMMEDGLLNEVEALLPYKKTNALQTVGYRELVDFLEGNTILEQAVNQIKINTRQYAKRQMTWFKKENLNWFLPLQLPEIIAQINKEIQ